MAAFEIGDPMPLIILMKPDNRPMYAHTLHPQLEHFPCCCVSRKEGAAAFSLRKTPIDTEALLSTYRENAPGPTIQPFNNSTIQPAGRPGSARSKIEPMANTVFCAKYKQEMEGLDEPPFDSELGQKVYKTVSKKAWNEWLERQKMLLNEYRLQPWTPQAQDFLVEQMNDFFYGSGGELPKEYVAPEH